MDSLLVLDNVWVVFASPNGNHEALRGVSLAVSDGEWVCILGANGSGKSTLGKVLTGLCDVSRGHIARVRPDMSVRMVFQNPDTQAIGQTVWEDVRYQPRLTITPFEAASMGSNALTRVGMWAERDKDVQVLSGGQKQRLAIAASTMGQTDLLVMDEATAMLDPLNKMHIWSTTQALHQSGQTVIWITQHLDEVRLASRVIVLQRGVVAFQGSPLEFFYPESPHQASPCERLGFDAPLPITVARKLIQHGFNLNPLPLSWDDLQRSL